MVDVSIDVKVVRDETKKWSEAFDRYGKNFLRNAAEYLLEASAYYLEWFDAIDTGELLNSGHVVETENGYQVVYDAVHAATVEFGRAAGSRMPPLDPIIKWVRRKGIDVADTKVPWSLMNWMNRVGLTTPSKSGRPTARHKLVARAFYIAKNISRIGIEQRPFLRSGIAELKSNIDKVIGMTKVEIGG